MNIEGETNLKRIPLLGSTFSQFGSLLKALCSIGPISNLTIKVPSLFLFLGPTGASIISKPSSPKASNSNSFKSSNLSRFLPFDDDEV